MTRRTASSGFTLIELSIVLVIIGLIVGGVLVGQDLIRAAQVRATISQVEKYNTAVNTFKGKYGVLPGDMTAITAAQYGFTVPATRAGSQGRGDGNGLVEGWSYSYNVSDPIEQGGEVLFFWEDLSAAHMIEGTFNTATDGEPAGYIIDPYLPSAKLGNGNYIYVLASNGLNYFGISAFAPPYYIDGNSHPYAQAGLTVQTAYSIDKKMDDGLPQTGTVTAQYVWGIIGEGLGYGWSYGGNIGALPGTAAAGSATTCYDNGGNASNPMQYSMIQNAGAGVNCGLSIQFQ